MSQIEAVIFDCDGVVVDSDALQVMAEQQTAAAFAAEHELAYAPDEIEWGIMQGWARKKIAARIYGVPETSETAELFRWAVAATTVEIATTESVPLIPGIVSLMDYLRSRSIPMGLATSSHRIIYSRYCEVHPIDFFPPGYIVTHGEAKDDKPLPGPYLEVIRRMNVDPKRTLIIEDSTSGITAGRYAGSIVLAVATTKPGEHLRRHTDAHLVAEDHAHTAYLASHLLR